MRLAAANPTGDITGKAPELCRLDAGTLARLVKRRDVSAREVIGAFLDHIAAINPTYNAIVSLRPRADILAEADAADAALARGEAAGPLHGLPQAIKDLAPTKGLTTTFGSPLFADFVPPADAIAVARMRAAGAIIIGKTNTPEFGLGSHTYNPVFGATRNAYAPARTAGGSSGGAAVALATRMLPVADGSDFGGSLRNPAAYNNIFGFRPSQGRVPSLPAPEGFFTQLGTEGPMARNAADLARLLSVQAGHDPRAPLSLDGSGHDYEAALDTDLKGKRIAWLGDLSGHLAMEDGILALCEGGLRLSADAGLVVEPHVPAFDFEALWQAFVALRHFMVGGKLKALYDDPEKREKLKFAVRWEIEGGQRLSAYALYEASTVRSAWYASVLRLFEHFDYLALPTAQVFPFPLEEEWPQTIAGRTMDSYHRWMEVVAPVTLSGCPAVSVPVGFNAAGLPMGMQLVGRPRDDLSVLQLVRAYEQVSPFPAVAP
ncbi:Asp-tRNAAsn/Glu-tRNAGln amidotransferase A subunit or related amidase [Chelatococcus sambhunathii]|uniref:Indoleacetamide hydrolase n=1 Tax=Chelatococcus sambhunathii TaxID=363953 RepID=A0ABP2A5Z7_9HYPH|nr:amidase [Chelatococcus sambhunathii]CUA88057.1 Asp-tRNAAsn/Glu-tRNAGln amidotransferase A subunit or related amidase [Chelatococcus sambhunathii]